MAPDSAVLDQKLTDRQTAGKTAVSSNERCGDSQPRFTGRLENRTGVCVGPMPRSMVMSIGPDQNLFLGERRLMEEVSFAGQKME